jgi:hypothetical protein
MPKFLPLYKLIFRFSKMLALKSKYRPILVDDIHYVYFIEQVFRYIKGTTINLSLLCQRFIDVPFL